jgi:signal transduction histidine kinase/CheY-like chemotaxis protein
VTMFKSNSKRKLRKQNSFIIQAKSFNLLEQFFSSIAICTFSMMAFLPFLLNKKFYDEDPSVPYSDGSHDVLIDISNACLVSCMMMMCIEALLDSNSLYLPISIAFPRFLMVLGVLIVSLSFYFIDFKGNDRLQFLTCMLFAKGYFICGGLTLKLVSNAVAERSKIWIMYVVAMVLYTTDFMFRQWVKYFPPNDGLNMFGYAISCSSFIATLFFVYKVIKLSISKSRQGKEREKGSYDVMSHLVLCVFYFGTMTVNLCYPSTTWKETRAAELAGYNFVGLFATVLFFFTSSHIAQRHFVRAEGQLINKKSFVRYVSHEIRTPLNTVYVGIQLLAKELNSLSSKDDRNSGGSGTSISTVITKLQDIVNDISESCFVSIHILNDLLLIDKIEEGNLKLDMKQKNARDIFRPCIHNFDVQAMFAKIDLSVDLDAIAHVNINADETKIVQVVRNIVSNALKFTPNGGHIHVKSHFLPEEPEPLSPMISAQGVLSRTSSVSKVHNLHEINSKQGKIRIEFMDTGPGISQANKAKLFESVIQFDANVLQSGGGSGLGLFISNAIMKRHPGGKIGVLSEGVSVEGKGGEEGSVHLEASDSSRSGCIFYIEMDGCVLETPAPSTAFSIKDETHPSNYFPICPVKSFHSTDSDDPHMFAKVLVVEDSKFNRKMMKKALARYATDICMAEDGVEAVEAVQRCIENNEPPYDVIFMDSLMPNMNGIDATKIIIKELNFPNPIIAVTGNMLPEDVKDFESAGVLTVLGKPLELERLHDVLHGECLSQVCMLLADIFLMS